MNTPETIADPKGDGEGYASGVAVTDSAGTAAATVPLPSVEPPPLRHQLKALRRVIVGLVLTYAVATIIYVFDLAMAVAANNGGSYARFKAIVSGETVTWGYGLQTATELACIVASLVWQYRATRNIAGLSSDPAVITPRWAMICWFVPVMFLFKPFMAVAQLWRISRSGPNWRSERTPWRLVIWWVLFWLLSFLSVVMIAAVSESPADEVLLGQAQAQSVFLSAIELAVLVAAALWAHIVSRITDLQHADGFRSLHLAAATRAAAIDLAPVAPAHAATPDPEALKLEPEKPETSPARKSASKTWTPKTWQAAAAVIAIVLFFRAATQPDNSPEAALRCVKLERQSTYISDMTHFVNSCSRPLNIRQCDKIVVAELWEILGGAKAEWNCTESYVPPGGLGATTLAARQDNSLFVTAFTNSRWQLEACFAPKRPVSLNEDKYQCR